MTSEGKSQVLRLLFGNPSKVSSLQRIALSWVYSSVGTVRIWDGIASLDQLEGTGDGFYLQGGLAFVVDAPMVAFILPTSSASFLKDT